MGAVRFLLYNIRYGTGGKRTFLPWGGYLRRTRRNLAEIVGFVRGLDPDVIGLLEVDAGSYRSHRQNQAQIIAESLGHYHTYRSKYGESRVLQRLPVVRLQGNAFVTRNTIQSERFHYFDHGLKRLVIELELEGLTIFLVHLSLRFRIRHHQLSQLYSLVRDVRRPCVVAGDFNAFWGEREICLFCAATGLLNANTEWLPSFPSWNPRRHLDFVLHSPEIRTTAFAVPRVALSDHLPLVWDFDVCSASAPTPSAPPPDMAVPEPPALES